MLSFLTRALVIYIVVIVAMRLMGKRQLAELQPSELVTTFLISNVASIYSASLGDSTSTRLQRDQAKQCILTVSLRPRPARRARLADHFPNPCAPLPMARGHDGPPPCLPRAGAAPGHRNRDGAGRVLATTMVVA